MTPHGMFFRALLTAVVIAVACAWTHNEFQQPWRARLERCFLGAVLGAFGCIIGFLWTV